MPTHPGDERRRTGARRGPRSRRGLPFLRRARPRPPRRRGRADRRSEALGGAVRAASVARRRATAFAEGCERCSARERRQRDARRIRNERVPARGGARLPLRDDPARGRARRRVTLVAVTGLEGILGLGPAVFLIAGALAVGPAGRISDRRRAHAGDPRRRSCSASSGPASPRSAAGRRSGELVVPRARALRRRAGDRAALACRRGRDVPARASGARHVVRALRRRLGRDLRAARLRPALRAAATLDAAGARLAVARLVARSRSPAS